MRKILNKRKGGFTLIELMIVVAIIGILAAIAIPNFIRFQLKARTSEGKANLAAIRTAEEAYNSEFGNYVSASASPASNGGNSKVAFTDTGTAPNNFATLGWSPEGQVFFNYEIVTAGGGVSFTANAGADIDGDSTDQAWGYFKVVGGTTADGTLGCDSSNMPAAGVETVGPCSSLFGQSVF